MNPAFPVTLGNGCAVTDRLLIVAGFPDAVSSDAKHTRLFYLNLDFDPDERWQHVDWPDHDVTSICLRKPLAGRARAGCALSDEGYVQIANSTEEAVERIPGAGLRDVESGHEIHGSVRGIAEAGATLYVCGYYGQIYRRTNDGWVALGAALRAQGVRRPEGDVSAQVALIRDTANLNAIDGLDETDVYTCGLAGHLYHCSGNEVVKLRSGTDAHLLDLHCVSPSETIVCGYNQTLLSGSRQGGFRLLHESPVDIRFYSVRKFQGDVYVGTTQGLWRFQGTHFDVVRQPGVGFGESTVVQQIDSVSDDYLWIVSDRHVFRYDGHSVERFAHPDN